MSGSTQPIVLVSEFPSTMLLLKNRIEESGYTFFASTAPEVALSPVVAVIPFNVQLELAQLKELTRAVLDAHPGIKIFGVNFGRMRFKLVEAYSAGVQFMYSLPFEEELLINKLFEVLPPEVDAKDLTLDQLMRVNVLELDNALALPFNLYLYLPANRKVIHYYHKDSWIDEKRVQKFKENAHYNLYLRRTELRHYKDYCAEVIAGGSAKGEVITENEKRKKSAERLMGLMSGFFSDDNLGEEDAQMGLDNLKGVVDSLETPGTSKELFSEINKIVAQQMTHVSHAQNVAAYTCLFGLALNAGDPTTLKMGGLLHDLGLADVPLNLIGLDLGDMDESDAAKYKLHPGIGKITIDDRKLKVPPEVYDMVLYHHERPDGSGYPYGKTSAQIPLLAKVCAFADEFDKLTSVRVSKRQLSPVEAVRRIAGLDGQPALSVYEEAVHRPLVDMLLKPRVTSGAPLPDAKLGSVQIENKSPAKSSNAGVLLKTLLENPKFAVKHSVGITRATPEYASLWQDLDDHWTRLQG